ncbi:MAG: hypothetical protein K5867_00675 [Bacteroidales bacterium]|nr:hypothetical protein [Bacteroidales bacterium]
MNKQEVYKELNGKRPDGYKINEVIQFSYPLVKAKIGVLANKMPDGSMLSVYNVILNAVGMGYDTTAKLFEFMGLGDTDEFMRNELHHLRDKGYLDLVSNNWYVSDMGKEFLENNGVMREEEKEDFEILVDGITGDICSLKSVEENALEKKPLAKKLKSKVEDDVKDSQWITAKYHELGDVYKSDSEGKAYLISSDDTLKGRKEVWQNYWLVEYVPFPKDGDKEAYLEVRDKDLKKVKEISKVFNEEYESIIKELIPERCDAATMLEDYEDSIEEERNEQEKEVDAAKESNVANAEELTIWETKEKFLEALSTVKEKLLIESPWIKQATREYIPYFEKILEEGKTLIILYGVDKYAEHDEETLNKLKEMEEKYNKFFLVNLPEHLSSMHGSTRYGYGSLAGTHRKIVIKDNDYYISGSFNFLSFARSQWQRVANEESMLIRTNVKEKWEKVMKQYGLPLL